MTPFSLEYFQFSAFISFAVNFLFYLQASLQTMSGRGKTRGGGRGGGATGRSKKTTSVPAEPPKLLQEFQDYLIEKNRTKEASALGKYWAGFRAKKTQDLADQAQRDADLEEKVHKAASKEEGAAPTHTMSTRSNKPDGSSGGKSKEEKDGKGLGTEQNADGTKTASSADSEAITTVVSDAAKRIDKDFYSLSSVLAETKLSQQHKQMLVEKLAPTFRTLHPTLYSIMWQAINPLLGQALTDFAQGLLSKMNPTTKTISRADFTEALDNFSMWLDDQSQGPFSIGNGEDGNLDNADSAVAPGDDDDDDNTMDGTLDSPIPDNDLQGENDDSVEDDEDLQVEEEEELTNHHKPKRRVSADSRGANMVSFAPVDTATLRVNGV